MPWLERRHKHTQFFSELSCGVKCVKIQRWNLKWQCVSQLYYFANLCLKALSKKTEVSIALWWHTCFWFQGIKVHIPMGKKFLFCFWVVISWLLFTLKLMHDYAKILIHELIHRVWLSIRLSSLIARHKSKHVKLSWIQMILVIKYIAFHVNE